MLCDVCAGQTLSLDTLQVLFSLNDQGGPIGTDDPSDDAAKINGVPFQEAAE